MNQYSFNEDKNLRRRMAVLTPKGAEFCFYLNDRRVFYHDGTEFTDAEARMLLRATKRLMRDAGKPHAARRPVAVGSFDDEPFALIGDRHLDADGRTVRQGPVIKQVARALNRMGHRRSHARH